jgi:nitrous oxidase accessory protein NosD
MSQQKNKLVLAATLALISVFLLGGVSFTLFPSQVSLKQHVQVEQFLPASSPTAPPILEYSVTSNTSSANNSAYAYQIAGFYFAYQLPGIAIEKDGSINSTTAPILRDVNTYTLTGDIVNQTIVVNCDNIIIDGAGHTLEGFYNGTNVYADEAISLQNVQNVTVENLDIDSFLQPIQAQDSLNLQIEENNFTNCAPAPCVAINLNSCNDSVIERNTLQGIVDIWSPLTHNVTMNTISEGIQIYQSSCDSITGNTLRNLCECILVEDSNSSIISNNIIVNGGIGVYDEGGSATILENSIYNVTDTGLWISGQDSNSTIVSNNVIANGTGGIVAGGNATILGNSIYNMTGAGVWISGPDNIIYENTIENAAWGVWLATGSYSEGSDYYYITGLNPGQDNIICENTIENVACGVCLDTGNFSGTVFYHNNFINNTQDLKLLDPTTAPVQWDYGKEGNYWSNYNGTSRNGDGIGDTPFSLGGNNTDFYPLMQPYFAQSSVTDYSTGRLLFMAALIVAVIGAAALLFLSVKSKFNAKRN